MTDSDSIDSTQLLSFLQVGLDHLDHGMTMYDADLRLVSWNKAFLDLMEFPADLIKKGVPVIDIIEYNMRRTPLGDTSYEDALAKRVDLVKNRSRGTFDRIRSDGRVIEINWFPLPDGGLVTTYHDVTVHRQRHKMLEHQKETAQLLQTITSAANTSRGSEGALRVCLDEVCAYSGWVAGHVYVPNADGSGQLSSSRIWHLDKPDSFDRFREVSEKIEFEPGVGLPGRVMATGEPAWITDLTKHPELPRSKVADECGIKSGFAFPVLVASEVVAVLEFFSFETKEPNQEIQAILASVGTQLGRALERQRSVEQLRQKERTLVSLNRDLELERDRADSANHAKTEFLAVMSHELRTPLNAVLGFSEIIAEQVLGSIGEKRYVRFAHDINSAAQHLLDLINDILDIAKVESGKEELFEDAVDVEKMWQSVHSLLAGRASENSIQLKCEIADDVPDLLVDRRKLKQILVNLLTNAIKFNAPGGKVLFKAWASTEGFVMQVEDNGIGIAPEDVSKALSRFGQIDRESSRQLEGTGLGLPLSKSLIELHGGSLNLESTVDVGTTITILLPPERVVSSPESESKIRA